MPSLLNRGAVFWFVLTASCVGAVGNNQPETPGGGGAGSGAGGGGNDDPGESPDPGDVTKPRPGEPIEQTFSCDADVVPAEPPLRRLTGTQYENTLRDLLTFALANGTAADSVMTALAGKLSGMPPSQRPKLSEDEHGTYRRIDQVVPQSLVDSAYEIGAAAGALLSATPHLGKAVGACATDAATDNDATCVADFIKRFGERALRRPLSADEIASFQRIYGSPAKFDPLAFTDVVTVMLSAPQFLYHVEHGAAEVAGKAGVAELSAFELAARLSYQFWNTMPDEPLWAAAKSGDLLDEATLRDQINRLLDDPRARAAGDDFFREWFKLEEIPALDFSKDDARFKAFAAGNLPTASLQQAVVDDALDMARHYAWGEPGSMNDLLGSNLSFARTQELATLYGTTAWNGSGAPPTVSADERPGFLTRAWFLATGSANSRPIMRGAFIRKHILCDDIPPPPDAAAAKPPELSPDLSTRGVVEAITEKVGGVCAACHQALINPIAFAFEGFDALGRVRTEERLFSASGQSLGTVPVDSHSIPQIVADDETPSDGAADVVELIRASGKPERCLSRNYFRYTFSRWDDPEADGCALERLRRVAKDGTLKDVMREVVFAKQFSQRSFR